MGRETGDMQPIRSYKDLHIWQEGIALVDSVYRLTTSLPSGETYGLTSQMRRAAVSVPANIAEGYARKHKAELRQFLYIALGSLAELETLGVVAQRQGFITARSIEQDIERPAASVRNKTLAFLRSLK